MWRGVVAACALAVIMFDVLSGREGHPVGAAQAHPVRRNPVRAATIPGATTVTEAQAGDGDAGLRELQARLTPGPGRLAADLDLSVQIGSLVAEIKTNAPAGPSSTRS